MSRRNELSIPSIWRNGFFPWLAAALLLCACAAGPRPATGDTQAAQPATRLSADAPREALARFLDAASRGDFEASWRLLSSPLRERYTPARLAEDFAAVRTSAGESLARARAALASEPRLDERSADFPISERKAVRLVRENDGWKVAALE